MKCHCELGSRVGKGGKKRDYRLNKSTKQEVTPLSGKRYGDKRRGHLRCGTERQRAVGDINIQNRSRISVGMF